MRYKEFKKAIEEWGQKYGYETEVAITRIYVCVTMKPGRARTMALIRTNLTGVLDTDWEFFRDIKEDARVELLSIIAELAATKPADREEKRFIIPLPGLVTTDGKQQYLSQDYNFFASRRDRTLKQTWKEEDLKFVPEIYRQFAVEFGKGKELEDDYKK